MTIKEALYAPLGEIKSRRGRGGTYDYVSWKNIADRMNEVFGVRWSSEVTERELIGNSVIVRVKVYVEDPETGHQFFQEGYGGAINDEAAEAGNPFKAAYSKAFKDACKKWGIGLYLEDDSPTETIPPGYMGREVGEPIPPSPQVMEQHLPAADQYVEKPSVPNVPVAPKQPAVPGMPSMPPKAPPVEASVTVKQEEAVSPPSTPSAPPTPPAPPTEQRVALKDDMPMSKVTTISTGEPEYISDVQKTALLSLLSIKGAKYEELAKEAFEFNGITKNPIPEPEKLTYKEAVCVIKYGHDKFRKQQ